jgi:NTP pyrophosphatase (non-canonical NTP hydrolase)
MNEQDDDVGITTLNDYQQACLRTAVRFTAEKDELCRGALGLTGEAGEVAEYIKKHLYHGHVLNKWYLKSELGDILWYIAVLADFLGFTLEEIATYNIEKLAIRYPEGVKKFVVHSRSRQDYLRDIQGNFEAVDKEVKEVKKVKESDDDTDIQS